MESFFSLKNSCVSDANYIELGTTEEGWHMKENITLEVGMKINTKSFLEQNSCSSPKNVGTF